MRVFMCTESRRRLKLEGRVQISRGNKAADCDTLLLTAAVLEPVTAACRSWGLCDTSKPSSTHAASLLSPQPLSRWCLCLQVWIQSFSRLWFADRATKVPLQAEHYAACLVSPDGAAAMARCVQPHLAVGYAFLDHWRYGGRFNWLWLHSKGEHRAGMTHCPSFRLSNQGWGAA